MARTASQYPTDVELAILRVLWERGPSAVGQVHEALAGERSASYSTTLKMMQVMKDKGLLLRDDEVWPALYRPAAAQAETQLAMLDDLVQKAFGGSAGRLVMRALAARRVSSGELAEMQKLVDEAQKREGKKHK